MVEIHQNQLKFIIISWKNSWNSPSTQTICAVSMRILKIHYQPWLGNSFFMFHSSIWSGGWAYLPMASNGHGAIKIQNSSLATVTGALALNFICIWSWVLSEPYSKPRPTIFAGPAGCPHPSYPPKAVEADAGHEEFALHRSWERSEWCLLSEPSGC